MTVHTLNPTENPCIAQRRKNCLELLWQRERELSSIKVQMYWQQQWIDLTNEFLEQQRSLMSVRAALENAPLQQLEANLSIFENRLIADCINLERQIKALNDPIAFLITLSRVNSIAAMIV